MSLPSNLQMRDAFITGLFDRAKADKDIVFISNEFGAPALDAFREQLPTQFINAGISEQNIISVAAGLASGGKKVFVYSIASFITLRCYEQLKLDLCVHNAPITILGVGSCFAYSEDGPTHHATEDIAVMRALAGLEIYSPAEAQQAYDLVELCCAHQAPRYIRFDKGNYPNLAPRMNSFSAGLRSSGEGRAVLLIATGMMSHRALEVADALAADGIATTVVDLFRLKPVDPALQPLLASASRVITMEEHTIIGGLGSLVAEAMAEGGIAARLRRFAVPEEFLYAYGTRENLHRRCGLDKLSMVAAIRDFVQGAL